jgi:aminoglycoside phosphotransferase (APT) family kinase protein
MRDDWPRTRPLLELDGGAVASLVAAALPGQKISGFAPLAGGLSNTNLVVALDGPPHRVVLRLYQCAIEKARTEAALSRMVQGRVPAPRFLHFAETNSITGGPYAVVEFVAGERFDLLAQTLDDTALANAAEAVGTVLAGIHAIRLPHRGFFDGDRLSPEAIDLGTTGLRAYLREELLHGPGGERLGAELTREVIALAESEDDLLERWPAEPCLTHADYNGSNILVLRHGEGWQVAAVLDWEFALSGIPAQDFAPLMRPPPAARPGYAEGIARGYRFAGGTLPGDWLRIARIADLFSWADMLGRPQIAPAVIADARAGVRAAIDAARISTRTDGDRTRV